MELYLITGKARSGKNHFADEMKKQFEKRGQKVCILKITSPLYHYAYDYFGWSGKEEDKPRSFLQQMGIEYIKEELKMPHFLLDRLSEDIMILNKFFDIGIITDGRLIEEIEELKRRYPDITTIHMTRPEYENDLTKEERNHITEKDLENYKNFNIKIENKNKKDLQEKAQKIVNERLGNK